ASTWSSGQSISSSTTERRELVRVAAVGDIISLMRRALLLPLVFVVACTSKAKKQADLAVEDVKTLEAIVRQRRIDSLPTALPEAAKKLPPSLADAQKKFPEMRDK